MQALKVYLENYTPLPEEDWQRIVSVFKPAKVRKNELLLQEGKICRHLYFLEQGLLRFYITKDGLEITKFFTEAPYCFTSQQSFTSGKAALENIQAIEDGIVWKVTLEDATQLLELKSWNTFVRKLIQEVQYYTEEILQELQTDTAENRYKKMLTTSPDLISRIPLKYLASYLGIAPQSLSRIRNKAASK